MKMKTFQFWFTLLLIGQMSACLGGLETDLSPTATFADSEQLPPDDAEIGETDSNPPPLPPTPAQPPSTPAPTPPGTPAPAPSPTPPLTPGQSALRIGDIVKVIGGPGLAYDAPSLSARVAGGHHNSAKGVLVNGPFLVNQENWWSVDFEIDVDTWTGKITDGWVQESFLILSPPINDSVAPYIQVSPLSGGAKGIVPLAATLQEPAIPGETVSGIAGVTFIVDGQIIGAEITASPFQIAWDSTTVADGAHIVTAISRDHAQNTRRAPPVVIETQNNLTASVTYYVASAGNDANDGLSAVQIGPGKGPWQTINKVQANMNNGLQPGTTFRFRRGDTFDGFVKLNSTRNITFGAYVHADGTDDPAQPRPMLRHGGSEAIFNFCCKGPQNWNLLIENLHLYNPHPATGGGGINVFSDPNTIGTYTMRNLEIEGGSRGMSNGAKGRFILENSILHDTWLSPLWASVPRDSVIRNNVFYGCGLRPTGLKEHCIYASGGAPDSYNLLIEGNHLTSSPISPGVIIVSRVKEGIHIRNNQTYASHGGDFGMYFGGWNDNNNPTGRPQQHVRDVEVSGNFISGRSHGLELSSVSDARVFNNVFYEQLGFGSFAISYGLSPSSHIAFFNNTIYNSDGNQSGNPAIRVVGWSRATQIDLANNILSTRRQKIFHLLQDNASHFEPTVRLRNNLYFFPNLTPAQSDLAKPYIFQNPHIQPIRFTLGEFQTLYQQEQNSQIADPAFVDEADPLGPDQRFGTSDDGLRLTPASLPAVGSGENFNWLGWGERDLLGNPRPSPPAAWDLGAYP